jgi:hypothetical protein
MAVSKFKTLRRKVVALTADERNGRRCRLAADFGTCRGVLKATEHARQQILGQ